MNTKNPSPSPDPRTTGQRVVEAMRPHQSRTAGERVFGERIARAGGSQREVAALGATAGKGATAPVTASADTDPIVKANSAPCAT